MTDHCAFSRLVVRPWSRNPLGAIQAGFAVLESILSQVATLRQLAAQLSTARHAATTARGPLSRLSAADEALASATAELAQYDQDAAERWRQFAELGLSIFPDPNESARTTLLNRVTTARAQAEAARKAGATFSESINTADDKVRTLSAQYQQAMYQSSLEMAEQLGERLMNSLDDAANDLAELLGHDRYMKETFRDVAPNPGIRFTVYDTIDQIVVNGFNLNSTGRDTVITIRPNTAMIDDAKRRAEEKLAALIRD